MSNEGHKELVRRLVLRTEKGLLDWKPAVEDDAFQVSVNENTILFSREHGSAGGAFDYFITLLNSKGDEADSFSDVTLDDGSPGGEWFDVLNDLFESARRTAMGSDKVLKKILDDLGGA